MRDKGGAGASAPESHAVAAGADAVYPFPGAWKEAGGVSTGPGFRAVAIKKPPAWGGTGLWSGIREGSVHQR